MPTHSSAAVKAPSSQVIDNVAGTHERVTVTKHGTPVAVLLAVDDLETLEISATAQRSQMSGNLMYRRLP